MATQHLVGASLCTLLPCRRPWKASAKAPRASRCTVIASSGGATDGSCRTAAHTRRSTLLAGAAALVAGLQAGDAAAARYAWDNESAALGSCAIGDDGDECRRNLLMKDRAMGAAGNVYGEQAARQGQLGDAITTGVPVSVLDDEYGRSTVALAALVERFAALDLYDPERVKAIAQIKKDGSSWVSKYARGGSARKQAARKMYIVVDALQGHFASNGFSPLAPAKLKKVLDNVTDAKQLLAAGK